MSPTRTSTRWLSLAFGPVAAALVAYALPADFTMADGSLISVTAATRATAALGAWMAAWWLTEAVHVSVTALLPVTLLPILGATTFTDAAKSYANDIIFLFLGGFLLSLAMQRWGLHRRIALVTLGIIGTEPRRLLFGFMVATAVMSVWVSNTATALMMLPIAASLISLDDSGGPRPFHRALMLGIAYAASIGGLGSIIGSPPNALVVSFARDSFGTEISFAAWLAMGLPLVAVLLPITWALLLLLYPVTRATAHIDPAALARELVNLGPMKPGEVATMSAFGLAVFGWITRPYLVTLTVAGHRPFAHLSDASVALCAALLLFVVPVERSARTRALDWQTAEKLPWGVLILFGGGLSLAHAVQSNGVAELLGAKLRGLGGLPPTVVLISVIALVVFLTEVTSNTATAATLIPLFAAMAPALNLQPYMLIFPTAMAASCAFMLPVATPPNAIVFATGYVSASDLRRAGIWVNLIAIVVLFAWARLVLPHVVTWTP